MSFPLFAAGHASAVYLVHASNVYRYYSLDRRPGKRRSRSSGSVRRVAIGVRISSMSRKPLISPSLVLTLAAISPAVAHHSFSAIFDEGAAVEITGTVTNIEWMNPHVWFYLDVENGQGEKESWAFEMGSPNRLMRSGWHQGSMQPGQTVTVVGSRARDGSRKAAVDTRHVSVIQRQSPIQATFPPRD